MQIFAFFPNLKHRKCSQMQVTRCGSLIINSVNICRTKQRAVLEEVRSRSVTRYIPQTATADLHALSTQLADVHQDNNLVSGNQQVLHAGSNHLMGGNQCTECGQRADVRVFKESLTSHSVFVIFCDHSTSYFSSWR